MGKRIHRLLSICLVKYHFSMYLLLGIFFVLPCIETYQKVDLRTITLDVPPQEVRIRNEIDKKPNWTSETLNLIKVFNILYTIFRC